MHDNQDLYSHLQHHKLPDQKHAPFFFLAAALALPCGLSGLSGFNCSNSDEKASDQSSYVQRRNRFIVIHCVLFLFIQRLLALHTSAHLL